MSVRSFTLYIARHGETAYNARRLMQGRSIDARLNDRGRRQASALGTRYADVPLDAVYASNLARAVETASAVAAPHGLDLIRMDSLAEMSWGTLEGQSIDVVGPYLRKLGEDWRNGVFEEAVGGGESILDVQSRASTAVAAIRERAADHQKVFVVTHGRFLRVLLSTILPDRSLADMDEFGHSNTGVYTLEFDGERFSLLSRNSTDHLDEPEVAGA